MKRMSVLSLALSTVLLTAGLAAAQAPPMPEPTAEHVRLQEDVGEWEAVTRMFMPGAPAMESRGSEKIYMLGAFWQVAEFEGEFFGQPFKGIGLTGWDPATKQYVSSWIDSTWHGISHGSATWDEATKTMTGTMEGVGPDGQLQKMDTTVTYPDENTRLFTMKTDGQTTMEITYTRKK